jgi:DNA-binding transcriptional MerR regulator
MATDLPADESYTIGDVAVRTGMSVHALRYYEQQDLLIGPVRRTAGGRRVYSPADVEWLMVCVKLRESGMPLVDLRRLADLVREGPGNEEQRLRLFEAHRRRVEAQIDALEECRSLIEWKVGVYREHLGAGRATGLWDPFADS